MDSGNGGHEVRVANPAGYDMPVQVARHARTRGVPEVQSYVKSLGVEHFFERAHHAIDRLENFHLNIIAKLVQSGKMPPRGNQHVPVVVGISIQQRDGVNPSADDFPMRVISLERRLTEKTIRIGTG